ncbi:unnamed protein product [Merluccius merluccius]
MRCVYKTPDSQDNTARSPRGGAPKEEPRGAHGYLRTEDLISGSDSDEGSEGTHHLPLPTPGRGATARPGQRPPAPPFTMALRSRVGRPETGDEGEDLMLPLLPNVLGEDVFQPWSHWDTSPWIRATERMMATDLLCLGHMRGLLGRLGEGHTLRAVEAAARTPDAAEFDLHHNHWWDAPCELCPNKPSCCGLEGLKQTGSESGATYKS